MTIHWTLGALSLLMATAGFASAEDLAPGQKIGIVRELLKSLKTKDLKPARCINSRKYIQRNLEVGDGPEGVKELIFQLPDTTKVNIARIFADGDFVVAQSEYYFFGPKVGFDIFRFEGGEIVEHWDNLEEKCSHLNLSGRSQLDGPTEVVDFHQHNCDGEDHKSGSQLKQGPMLSQDSHSRSRKSTRSWVKEILYSS
jgi:predicted SnoaL-like aldol condensation-catalyzing enzyme